MGKITPKPAKLVWEGDEEDKFISMRSYGSNDDEEQVENPSLEQIAYVLDQESENANHGDMVGSHKILSLLLLEEFGREKATKIMLKIVGYNGLDFMVDSGWSWDESKRIEQQGEWKNDEYR